MYKALIYVPILFVLGCQRNIEKTNVTEELVLSIAENGSIYSPNESKTVVLMNMSNRVIEFIGSRCVNETQTRRIPFK